MHHTIESINDVYALMDMPFLRLVHLAQTVHQEHFDSDEIEQCKLLNIKTGRCPEDCGYCTQSAHYQTGLTPEPLFDEETILNAARAAKAQGATRFCMGAAWRRPPEKSMPHLMRVIASVKALGLETCITLGMLNAKQAENLKEAGLDYYNHNLDTSEKHYPNIVTTHSYQDRLDTLEHVQNAGINVCSGGILGMNETREDRAQFLFQYKLLKNPPQSIPINKLIPMPGTPLANAKPIDPFEFIRTIAAARIMFPRSRIRLSAGRTEMSDEMQAWCYMAGANSIFIGDKLLTAGNPSLDRDHNLFERLQLQVKTNAAITETR